MNKWINCWMSLELVYSVSKLSDFLNTPCFFPLCEQCSYLKLLHCRWTPYGKTKCIICKQQMHQDGKYCHTCAYSKGDILCFDGLHLLLYCFMKVHNSVPDLFCICRSLCDVWQAISWHQVFINKAMCRGSLFLKTIKYTKL